MIVWLSGGVLRKDHSGYLDDMSPHKKKSSSNSPTKYRDLDEIPPDFLLKFVLMCA